MFGIELYLDKIYSGRFCLMADTRVMYLVLGLVFGTARASLDAHLRDIKLCKIPIDDLVYLQMLAHDPDSCKLCPALRGLLELKVEDYQKCLAESISRLSLDSGVDTRIADLFRNCQSPSKERADL